MSSPPKNNNQDTVKHSRPIPINTGYGTRRRSVSVSSSSDSSSSPTSPPQPPTPLSNSSPPRMVPTNLSPSSSPILSYFMSQSPTKTPPTTFPFTRKFGGPPPVFEGLLLRTKLCSVDLTHQSLPEEEAAEELPAVAHARRASTAGRFGPQATAPPAMPDPHCERGASVLRRLSLGNAFSRVSTLYIIGFILLIAPLFFIFRRPLLSVCHLRLVPPHLRTRLYRTQLLIARMVVKKCPMSMRRARG